MEEFCATFKRFNEEKTNLINYLNKLQHKCFKSQESGQVWRFESYDIPSYRYSAFGQLELIFNNVESNSFYGHSSSFFDSNSYKKISLETFVNMLESGDLIMQE